MRPGERTARQRVLQKARAFVRGQPLTVDGYTFDKNPVGFVRAAYWAAGIELFDETEAAEKQQHGMAILVRSLERRQSHHNRRPIPGDLVFLNSPKASAYPAQVAIVEQVLPDGAITALGTFKQGPARITVNSRHPDRVHRRTGGVTNDLVATQKAGSKKGKKKNSGRVPAGSLLSGYASPFGPASKPTPRDDKADQQPEQAPKGNEEAS